MIGLLLTSGVARKYFGFAQFDKLKVFEVLQKYLFCFCFALAAAAGFSIKTLNINIEMR